MEVRGNNGTHACQFTLLYAVTHTYLLIYQIFSVLTNFAIH